MLARCSRKSMDSFLEWLAAQHLAKIADIVVAVRLFGIVVDAVAVRRLVVDKVVAAVAANRKPGRRLEVGSTGKVRPDVCG